MNQFLTDNFLLNTSVAKKLYFEYAANMPIIDYHCHVSPKEIYENKRFSNITELWLAHDHYKWRLMRADGIDEYYITGEADDYEKFYRFASVLSRAIGNSMYHWCHLELKNYFGYDKALCADTAREVWELTKQKLCDDNMRVREIIKSSGVEMIGTTDDPTDTLEYHALIAEDDSFGVSVLPTFRPDRALNIDKMQWKEYIISLGSCAGVEICDLDTLKKALSVRMDYFASHGCRASDHGLDCMVYEIASENELDIIIKKGLDGEKISQKEADALKTHLLVFCAEQYKKRSWVMQLHYNCMRNPNSKMYSALGADSGFDCIYRDSTGIKKLGLLLDRMNSMDYLPKTVIYSLDGGDNNGIDSLIGSFQKSGIRGYIQHGSAWWFNDSKTGMREQMTSLANLGLLANFIGMLTDSRSFVSYARHEYFRRILCSLIGEWVENGEYPCDISSLGEIVRDICYYNAKRYFEL